MNVLIPMTGQSSRFAPNWKPAVEVCGKPILQWTLDSFPKDWPVWIMVRSEHYRMMDKLRANLDRHITVIQSNRYGKGPADTILDLEGQEINCPSKYDPILIANCDQYVVWDHTKINSPNFLVTKNLIPNPRFSYVIDGVVKVQEDPNVHIVTGLYGFSSLILSLRAAEWSTKYYPSTESGEWYLCNILERYRVDCPNLECERFFPLGTPDDVQDFELSYGMGDWLK